MAQEPTKPDREVRPEQEETTAAQAAEAEEASSIAAVLQNRHFLLLWLAQALSQTAQNAIWYGLVVVVEESSRSTTQLGLAVLSTIIPPIALGMAAGVVVDRVNKKGVLVVTNLLRALTVFGYLLYPVSLVYVYLVNLILVGISQFFAPAEAATIPALVPKKQLISATSLFNLTFTGSQLAGIVLLGPPLIKLLGVTGLFIGCAVAFGLAAVLVSPLPSDVRPPQGLKGLEGRRLLKQVWTELLEGWRFANSDRLTRSSMVHLTIASGLILMMSMLVPRFVVSVLQIAANDAAYIFAPAGVGVVLGTLFLSRLSARFRKTSLVSFGLLLTGGSLIVLAALSRLGDVLGKALLLALGAASMPGGVGLIPWVMIVVTATGFAYSLVSVPSQTIIMEQAPVESRGRIFAAQMTLANVAAVLPLVFLGGLADLFGVSLAIALIGAGVCYAGVRNVRRWQEACVSQVQPGSS